MKMKKLLCLLSLVFALILAVSAAVWASGEESDKLAVENTVIENGKYTFIGALKTDELTYSSLTLDVTFKQDGETVKVKTQEFTSVCTTVTGYASVDTETATAREYQLVDGYYLVALTVNNVPTGIYDVEVTLSGVYTGNETPETLASEVYSETKPLYNGECVPVYMEATDPACEKYGTTEGYACADCGKTLVGCERISPLGHSYVGEVCSRCGTDYGGTGGLTYEVFDDHAVVTGYTSNSSYVRIPDKFEGLPVTEIGKMAFSANTNLSTVVLPRYLTTVDRLAFGDCKHIDSMYFPLSLTYANTFAFYDLYINDVYYEGTEEQWKAIEELHVQSNNGIHFQCYCPGGVHCEVIDPACGPATCESPAISEGCHCSLCGAVVLDQRTVVPARGHNFVDDACTVCGAKRFSDGLIFERNGDTCSVVGYTGSDSIVTIPSTYFDGLPVTEIAENAFDGNKNIIGVKLPDSLKVIAFRAFSNCTALKTVTFPSGVEKILTFSFIECSSLESVVFPKSINRVDSHAFHKCENLTDVYYEGSESDWGSIPSFAYGNGPVNDATIHYGCSAGFCAHIEEVVPGYAPTCTEDGLSDKVTCLLCDEVSGGEVLPATGHDFGNNYVGTNCKNCGMSNLYAGNVVLFGNYEQDNDNSNGKEDIEWIVLDVDENGSVTLVSKYVLIGSTYHTDPDAVTWEESALYAYLNGEFLNAAFSETEKDAISRARLLDKDEAGDYFPTTADRRCALTAYARTSGVVANTEYPTSDGKLTCIWWLMTPGDANEMADVVSADGSYSSLYAVAGNIGVRPVISVNTCAFSGHTPVTDAAVPHTCYKDGLTEGSHCAVCGKTLVAQKVDPASHTKVVDIPAVAETCYTDGKTEGSHCSVCGETLSVYGDTVPAHHTFIGEDGKRICSACEQIYFLNEDGESYTFVGYVNRNYPLSAVISSEINGKPVTAIGESAMSAYGGNGDATLTVPASIVKIDRNAFINSRIADLYIESLSVYCNIDFGDEESNPIRFVTGKLYVNGEPVTDLVIPDDVTAIPDYAFYGCNIFTSAVLGSKVETVGKCAFANCDNLTSVTFDDNCTTIGESAFNDCDMLKEVVLNEGLTAIGENAFYSCDSLSRIVIPASLEYIGKGAFDWDYELGKVEISDMEAWCSIEFGDWYANPILEGESALYLNGERVTTLVIPEGITDIPAYAFTGCSSIRTVVLPESLEYIGYGAFYNCISLVEIINHSSIELEIGSEDNGDIAVYAAVIHNGEESILVNVNGYIFCPGETNYLIGYVGTETDLVLPEDFNGETYEIYPYAFYERDDLTSVVISDGVTRIGEYAFCYCSSVRSLVVGNNVEYIDECAFYDNCEMRVVTLGKGLYNIYDDAFEDCEKLVEVINHSALEISAGSEYYGYVAYYAVVVHDGSESVFVNVDGYIFYDGETNYLVDYVGTDTDLVLPENFNGETYKIRMCAFEYREDITSVVISAGVTAIGEYAFYDCPNLTYVEFENGVVTIDEGAFYDCTALTEVVLCDSLESIGEYAFRYCYSLEKVTFGENLESIKQSAFYECYSLKEAVLGDNVSYIGEDAFYQCHSLESVTLGRNVETIEDYAFGYCERLTTVINRSSLDIEAGSSAYGQVARYAKTVIDE